MSHPCQKDQPTHCRCWSINIVKEAKDSLQLRVGKVPMLKPPKWTDDFEPVALNASGKRGYRTFEAHHQTRSIHRRLPLWTYCGCYLRLGKDMH